MFVLASSEKNIWAENGVADVTYCSVLNRRLELNVTVHRVQCKVAVVRLEVLLKTNKYTSVL